MNGATNGQGSNGKAASQARPIKLSCRNVWKVYGPDPAGFIRGGSLAATDRAETRARLKESGHLGGRHRRQLRRPCRRDLRHHGAFGLRQIDHRALPVAAGGAHRRPYPARRRGSAAGERAPAHRSAPARHGHGVPEFRPAAASDGAGQCRLPLAHPGQDAERAPCTGARDDRARGPRRAASAPFPISSPAASSSASASPARWPWGPSSGSWTSPSRRWIR